MPKSKLYEQGFRVAAILVPVAMAIAGYFFGNVEPFVETARDFCSLIPPAPVEAAPVGDAGVSPSKEGSSDAVR